jgi:hypothetical protein
MAGSVTIQGQITGLPAGSQYVGPFTRPASSSSEFETFPYTFNNFTGTSQTAVPTWANSTIFTFNAGATGTVALGGSSADTGVKISLTVPTCVTWEGETSFWLVLASFVGTGWITHF